MARSKEDKKTEIIAAMREHLLLVGPRDYEALQDKFPDVSRPTFYRYLKIAREALESAAAADSPAALRMAQARIHSQVAQPAKTMAAVKAHMPVMPSPAVIAGDPGAASQAFKFFAFFQSIVEDADLLRSTAVVVDADGKQKVRNPAMLDKVITRRLGIAQTYLNAFEAVYNAERIQQLYEVIVEEVGKASPEVQMAVLAVMRELDNKRGLTMGGNV